MESERCSVVGSFICRWSADTKVSLSTQRQEEVNAQETLQGGGRVVLGGFRHGVPRGLSWMGGGSTGPDFTRRVSCCYYRRLTTFCLTRNITSPSYSVQRLLNNLSSSGLFQNRKKKMEKKCNSIKTFQNQLSALPVSSEPVDEQTAVTASLWHWGKLKNVMFLRQVLHMWGASLLRISKQIYGVLLSSSMLMKLRWRVAVHRTFVELQLLRFYVQSFLLPTCRSGSFQRTVNGRLYFWLNRS